MPGAGRAGHVGSQLVFDPPIRVGKAFVLTTMFCPRANQECFDVAVRFLKVPVNAPTVWSIPAPNAAALAYRVEEPPRLSASDLVLDRNQYGAH
jgi:hypothetical protein